MNANDGNLNYNIIKDIRNPLRLEKETKTIKKENKTIKDRILTDIKNLFENQEEGESYYKQVSRFLE